MKVVATEMGFVDGNRVRAGTVFDVPEGSTAKWYVPLESAASKAKPEAKAKAVKPEALSQMGRDKPKTFTEVHAEKPDLA